MAAKETHIATLQDAAASEYFGCVYGEARKARLATFSGCDLVIASDSVVIIGDPSGVGLATMWLERRKLKSRCPSVGIGGRITEGAFRIDEKGVKLNLAPFRICQCCLGCLRLSTLILYLTELWHC